jgi:SAM-dependent methyltransferase
MNFLTNAANTPLVFLVLSIQTRSYLHGTPAATPVPTKRLMPLRDVGPAARRSGTMSRLSREFPSRIMGLPPPNRGASAREEGKGVGLTGSWRRALLPGEGHGFWQNPGWYDARALRAEDDHDDLPAMRAALVRALPPLRPDGKVLDLGAGTGALSLLLASFYPHLPYTLLDGREAALGRAQEKLFSAVPDLQLTILADTVDPVANMPLPGGSYQLVTSSIALHDFARPAPPDDADGRARHHADHVALLRRVWLALEPGGHFIYGDAMHAGFRVAEHLATLTEAGFLEVDCAYVAGRLLVCGGQRRSSEEVGR